MFKLTNDWNSEKELAIRQLLGQASIIAILSADEKDFSNQMIGILEMVSLTESEKSVVEQAALSDNRIRLYHTVLFLLFRELTASEETQTLGVDQEDIDQQGLVDESNHLTLLNERSFQNICNSCPLLNDMDSQDLVHFFTNN